MKNFAFFAITFTCLSLLSGCNNSKSGQIQDQKLKMVEIPAIITDPSEKNLYVVEHFWDSMNFHDTTYISNEQSLNVHFSAYLDYLSKSTKDAVWASVGKLTDSLLKADNKILFKFREMLETALYHPNSIFRNEELYILVLEKFTKSDRFPQTDKAKLQQQLELAYRNRIGTKALDFKFYLKDGSQKSLYGIKSDYLILIFIDPDCPTCKANMEQMQSSPVLTKMGNKLKILTMYAGADIERWQLEAPKLYDKWINGCDKDMKIMEGPQYDLRPTPSLYLLDKNKTVLLKDAPLQYIEEYLKSV